MSNYLNKESIAQQFTF